MVDLGEMDISDDVIEWLDRDASRGRMVTAVANALMREWFPRNQPVGEDLDNWLDCAVMDASTAVRCLIEGAWIDDPTMD